MRSSSSSESTSAVYGFPSLGLGLPASTRSPSCREAEEPAGASPDLPKEDSSRFGEFIATASK